MVAFADIRPVRGVLGFPTAASAAREAVSTNLSIRERRPPRLVARWRRDAHGHLACRWEAPPQGDDACEPPKRRGGKNSWVGTAGARLDLPSRAPSLPQRKAVHPLA
jgi:hypothetical protein